jgi:hypothetical protein
MSNAEESTYHDPHTSHEQSDVSFGPVVGAGVVLAIMCLLSYVIVLWVFHVFAATGLGILPGTSDANLDVAPMEHVRESTPPQTYPLMQEQAPVGPGIQPNPPADLAALHAEEDAILDTYGWVDRENGVVRIPIERAMQLIVKQGLPSRPNPPAVEGPQFPEASSSGRMMEQLVP